MKSFDKETEEDIEFWLSLLFLYQFVVDHGSHVKE
jgi:hypothetical protein